MSLDDFKKYGKMISDDENVRAKAKEIGINDIDGQISYAKTLGLEFGREDMEAMAKEVGYSQDELSEEDLEKIAGGAATVTALAVIGAVVGAAALGISVATAVQTVLTTVSRDW